jgi:hypothetical protein
MAFVELPAALELGRAVPARRFATATPVFQFPDSDEGRRLAVPLAR